MKQLFDDERQMLASLQAAVCEALDRKHRLGQYAVIWADGRPAFIGPNPPSDQPGNRFEGTEQVSGKKE